VATCCGGAGQGRAGQGRAPGAACRHSAYIVLTWCRRVNLPPGALHYNALHFSLCYAVWSAVPEARRLEALSPVMLAKARKNPVEVRGMEEANLRDAVALVSLLAELEAGLVRGEKWTELGVAARLEEFRAAQPLYRGPSFQTIAAYGAHGAVIHYKVWRRFMHCTALHCTALQPTNETDSRLGTDSLFLLDSGGQVGSAPQCRPGAQYLDGTTDVTMGC
jgi:Xaa-Pro aminopeptidase